MTFLRTRNRSSLTVLGLLVIAGCAACGPTGEPPNLPAPEYEAPRSYDPDKPIDTMGGAEAQALPDAPPPPEPATTSPTEASPPPAEGTEDEGDAGAGGAAAEAEPTPES